MGTSESRTDRSAVVYAGTELDLSTAPELRSDLEHALETSDGPLVVNLERTTFMDSAGIRELILILKRCRTSARRMVLVTSQPAVLTLLKMTGIEQMVTIEPAPTV